MKLRPHHLLCTQAFTGKGYSEAFVRNMTAVTTLLRDNPDTVIRLVSGADDICGSCPRLLGGSACMDGAKVAKMDEKVVRFFGLELKGYSYREIVREIASKITADMLEDICADCVWYAVSDCSGIILEK